MTNSGWEQKFFEVIGQLEPDEMLIVYAYAKRLMSVRPKKVSVVPVAKENEEHELGRFSKVIVG